MNHDGFLSHLCGGEPSVWGLGHASVFLSHLCGGELKVFLLQRLMIFLSHLCGGELTGSDEDFSLAVSKPPMWW
ncbi:hypothetical protein BSPWISOX_2114 [uncultured Gammaproteobacteria bacterium]|nr:hypothetical protein BSPWISOX_2114 [uncultured Gammaproteobacteria bacterium]